MEKKPDDSIHINILEALEMQPSRVQNQKKKKKVGSTELKLDEEEMPPPTSRKIP